MTWRQLERQGRLWDDIAPSVIPSEPVNGIVEKAFRTVKPRTPVPEIEVKFRRYADVNNVIRIRDGKVRLGLSDVLENAPPAVLKSIAVILLSKLYRKEIPEEHQECYRRYLNRRSVRRQAQAIRSERGRKWIGAPQGFHFNLEEMFDRLNRHYFGGAMQRPRLSWSRSASRRILGHFDAAHNAIIVSKVFDRPHMPPLAVEYILYHEMLHLKHPVTHARGRRCFHSSLFREDEKRFEHFAEAKRLIEKL